MHGPPHANPAPVGRVEKESAISLAGHVLCLGDRLDGEGRPRAAQRRQLAHRLPAGILVAGSTADPRKQAETGSQFHILVDLGHVVVRLGDSDLVPCRPDISGEA
jgi:hypothetical protein